MLLSNLYSLPGEEKVDILIEDKEISSVSRHTDSLSSVPNSIHIRFEDAIVFPGLINSHDHLDYNSFPQLGNKVYKNYVEWGEDIHKQNKDVINKVLKIPKELSIQWGIYKNLLNGITTVVNHGPKLQVDNNLITVWQQCHTLHSVQLERKWKIKLNRPFIKKQTFAVHIGEGTDSIAEKEIDELIKWNLFKRELIGIHAIAMNGRQAAKFKAIVWCPDSNYFLIGKTAVINELKHKTEILFGADSTLSAKWNLWDHLRLARQEKMIGDNELFDALTANAANIWGMSSCGSIVKNNSADVVIARREKGLNGMDSFFAVNPEDILLVMHKGQIVLLDDEIRTQLLNGGIPLNDFHKITINGIGKYVLGNLPELIKAIREYYPEANFPVTC